MFTNKLLSISTDGNSLAICNTEGILKVWDCNSSRLEHEFHPSEHLSSTVTCIKYSMFTEWKISKSKKNPFTGKFGSLIALGTVEGTVLIYDPIAGELKQKLLHSVTSSVTDLCWRMGMSLVSIGENKKLIVWDVNNAKPLYSVDIIGITSLSVLSDNQYIVGNTNIQCLSYDLKTKTTADNKLSGHKTSITQFVPVFLNNESSSRYFLSAAENDRYVYAWSTNTEFQEPVGSFMVNEVVRSVSCIDMGKSSVSIAVTTQKGYLRMFSHHMNGSKNAKPSRFELSLHIQTLDKDGTTLPILHSRFLSTTELLIVYGQELFPHCERVELDSLKQKETIWFRQDPSVFRRTAESRLLKTVVPHVPNTAMHLKSIQTVPTGLKEVNVKRKRGTSVTENLPMEERLVALSLTQSLPGMPDGKPLDNYTHLLVQALHSKDKSLMNSILEKGDEDVINNTVRRLPVAHVVPFLQYLQDYIMGKGNRNITCISWIKSLLYHHMSHLSTVPDKESLLQPFYSIFSARTQSLLAASKLHARISLVLTQVKNRHENVLRNTTSELPAEVAFRLKDDSSDEEDVRTEVEGGPSESEDIWDDWTEDEENEEDDEEEEETSKKRSSGAEKRKLSSRDEDYISLNGSGSDSVLGDDAEEGADEDEDIETASESD